MSKFIIYLALTVGSVTQVNAAGLTGSMRYSFIDSAAASCRQTMNGIQLNTVQTLALASYCSCYAEGMADVVTNEEATAAFMKQDPSGIVSHADAVIKTCKESMSK